MTDVFEALLTDHCVAAPWLVDMPQVSGEEARGQEIQSEEVLEAENGTKYHPDQEMMRRNSVRRE